MTLQKIIQFLGDLINKSFTGSVTFNFHRGDISKKVKKEVVENIE